MNTLPFSPPDATQIGTSCFSFASQNGRTFSFSNLEPFDCHDEDDRQALLLRLARFARHGVPHRDLMAAFGISRTRVHRALDRLQRQGEAAFHRPRRGRGTQVITGALKETANRLLASGMSGAAVARELGVSVATLNHNRRRGFLGPGTQGPESEPAETTLDPEVDTEAEAEAGTEAEAGGDLLDRSARDRRDRAAPMGRAARDCAGRVAASAGVVSNSKPQSTGTFFSLSLSGEPALPVT